MAGFVDHHTHALRVAAGARPPYDLSRPASIGEYHRAVAARGSSPMDEPPEPSAAGPLEDRIEAELHRAATAGIVQLTEAGVVDERHIGALRVLRERGPLPVRVRLLIASGLAERRRDVLRSSGDSWLDIIGVKFYADGWLGPATCALCDPFAESGDDRGVLFQDASTLASRIDPVAEAGMVVATHAIGDRAIETVLDAYDSVYGRDCAAEAPRIEHAQVLHDDLIARMADMGVVACIQPSFAVSDAVTARERLGEKRAAGSYRWDALLAAGVPVIGGSDFPIEAMEPLVGLQHLVTGLPLDADADEPPIAVRLSLADALAVMTDATCGTTTLDADPGTVAPADLSRIAVVATDPT